VTVYAVPSYRRPEGCATRTVTRLAQLGVALTAIEVWLSDPDETAAYQHHLPAEVRVRPGAPTLRGNRAAIMRGHPNTDVVFCDDDLDDVVLLDAESGKARPARPGAFAAAVAEGFALARAHGLRLWGVAPVPNHYFMKSEPTVGRSFCIGSLYGLRVPAEPSPYVTNHDEKEDYERSLRAWERDGAVVRLNHVAPKTTYYRGGGGMVDGRTVEAQEDAVRFIERRWPGAVRRNTRRKSEYPEIVINPQRRRK
jgi:hypothetical protein